MSLTTSWLARDSSMTELVKSSWIVFDAKESFTIAGQTHGLHLSRLLSCFDSAARDLVVEVWPSALVFLVFGN